jgi:hypothetical protein
MQTIQASLRLVRLGDDMASRLGAEIPAHLQAGARRVPGCVSVVNIAAELKSAPGVPLDQSVVYVRGSADARVARCLAFFEWLLFAQIDGMALSFDDACAGACWR